MGDAKRGGRGSNGLPACGGLGPVLVGLFLLPVASSAQSLPLLHPMNPMVESRTAVYFQPYLDPSPRWRIHWGVDYASLAEFGLGATRADTSYLLDAELLRLNLAVSRDLGARMFVTGEFWLGGAYPGVLDGFVNWYHGLFGIRFPERENRDPNDFAYRYELPAGRMLRRSPVGLFLGDARIGLGRRHDGEWQSVLTLALPTATGPGGYGRGTVGVGVLNTVRTALTPRLSLEGSANLGFTPRHGELARYQSALGLSLTSGFRWRFWGRLSAFANLYFATPYYHDTQVPALDRYELTMDFGWMFRTRDGREWRIGMTEDLEPSGPAIDLDFRVGGVW